MPNQAPLIAKTLAEAEALREQNARTVRENEAVRADLVQQKQSAAVTEAEQKATADRQRETDAAQAAKQKELDDRADAVRRDEKRIEADKQAAADGLAIADEMLRTANAEASAIRTRAIAERNTLNKRFEVLDEELKRREGILTDATSRLNAREAQLEQREIDLSRDKETYRQKIKDELLRKLG